MLNYFVKGFTLAGVQSVQNICLALNILKVPSVARCPHRAV